MQKKIIIISTIIFFSLSNLAFSQTSLNLWQDEFSYINILSVCQTNNKTIVGASKNGLLIVNTDGSIEKKSKASGLSDVGISAMNYVPSSDVIVLGYSNGNIDILSGKKIINIADIKRKNMNTDKIINSISIAGNYAYLSCGFGIVKLDIAKAQIADTYFIGQNASFLNVYKTIIVDDSIYAATDKGLFSANTNDFLADFNNWHLIYSSPFSLFKDIAYFNGAIYAIAENSASQYQLIKKNSSGFLVINSDIGEKAKIFVHDNLYIANQKYIFKYNSNDILTERIDSYGLWDFKPDFISFDSQGNLIIADQACGIITHTKSNYSFHLIEGVYLNESMNIKVYKNTIFVTRGGYKSNLVNLWRNANVSIFSNNTWTTISQPDARDFVCILADSSDLSHFYIGSWGYGLFEYKNGKLLNHYDQTNSPLESIIQGAYVRISGLAYDKEKNIWMINQANDNSINILRNNGTWKSLVLNRVLSNIATGELIYTSNNQIWVQLFDKGLFVLDYNNTIDNENDDIYKLFFPRDENGELIGSRITCIAEDKDGEIWFGSDEGVGVIYDPASFDGTTPVANRIKITSKLNDSLVTSYLLENDQITSIAIDGGNRKWFGTASTGVFLLNSNGTKQILHFDAENSPLPSNKVLSIAVDPQDGEVYFSTTKGVVSYRGTATEGANSFQNVYAYPNPVRHSYTGTIYIKGLVRDSEVKITDIAGNIVYQTTSNGGMATWNGKNFDGNRVSTGIYLIFCSNSDGSDTFVSKLLFIK